MAPTISKILELMFHPNDIRHIISYKLWREPLNERDPEKETPNERKCFELLEMTSRSFCAVIQELNSEIRKPVILFYLILRGLDTIEDDMTIPIEKKVPLLVNFHQTIFEKGWKFLESGPEEKDAPLLRQFDIIIDEFLSLDRKFQEHIATTTKEMGSGMAMHAKAAAENGFTIETKAEYNRYCYYVAGLVGIGLSLLFSESHLEDHIVSKSRNLSLNMGLMLQKTNIIRDLAEDLTENRIFWPKEIWSKYCKDIHELQLPEKREDALNCISEMVADALEHAKGSLAYLSLLRTQSVFNFCAIPQVMALKTLALIYRNPNMITKNVKIRRGQSARVVADIFLESVREIHRKSSPKDPNFLRISVVCGEIEQCIETIFPKELRQQIESQHHKETIPEPTGARQPDDDFGGDTKMLYLFAAGIWVVLLAVMMGIAYLGGARFDIATQKLKEGFGEIYGNFTELLAARNTARAAGEGIKQVINEHQEL